MDNYQGLPDQTAITGTDDGHNEEVKPEWKPLSGGPRIPHPHDYPPKTGGSGVKPPDATKRTVTAGDDPQ